MATSTLSAGPIEERRSAKREYDGNGTGTRIFTALYEHLDNDKLPRPAISRFTDGITSQQGTWRDNLICTEVNEVDTWGEDDHGNPAYITLEASYRTAPELDGNWKISMEGTSKLIERGYGRKLINGKTSEVQSVFRFHGARFTASKVDVFNPSSLSAMLSVQGSVNKFGWSSPWGFNFGAGKLLFEHPTFEDFYDKARGVHLVHIRCNFSAQPWPHNKIWDISEDGISYLTEFADGPTYPEIDFCTIFGGSSMPWSI